MSKFLPKISKVEKETVPNSSSISEYLNIEESVAKVIETIKNEKELANSNALEKANFNKKTTSVNDSKNETKSNKFKSSINVLQVIL